MITYETNYLAHHGVLGMKWGVRRYQNKDGSLTAEGRRHVNSAKEANKRLKKANREAEKLIKKNKHLKSGFVNSKNIDDAAFFEYEARNQGLNTDAYWNAATSYSTFVRDNKKSISIGKKILEQQKKK